MDGMCWRDAQGVEPSGELVQKELSWKFTGTEISKLENSLQDGV